MAEEYRCDSCKGFLCPPYKFRTYLLCTECLEKAEGTAAALAQERLIVDSVAHDGIAYTINPPLVLRLKESYWDCEADKCIWGYSEEEVDHAWYTESGIKGEHLRNYEGVTGATIEEIRTSVAESIFSWLRILEEGVANKKGTEHDTSTEEGLASLEEDKERLAVLRERVKPVS